VSEWSHSPITSASAEPSPLEPDAPVEVTQLEPASLDLNGIESDLAAVEVALERLDSGSYWTDEVTGAEISDALLEADPTARRATDR
jgi:RNA polymerase-binding transcription factor DksA